MRHQHQWNLISKEFVPPRIYGTAQGMADDALERIAIGYWSYVFRCECGEVKVERS